MIIQELLFLGNYLRAEGIMSAIDFQMVQKFYRLYSFFGKLLTFGKSGCEFYARILYTILQCFHKSGITSK